LCDAVGFADELAEVVAVRVLLDHYARDLSAVDWWPGDDQVERNGAEVPDFTPNPLVPAAEDPDAG
jgi:hypothetical protein